MMNVMIAMDENFVNYYKIVLVSLFSNNTEEITVYLFYTDSLSKNSIKELELLVTSYGNILVSVYVDRKNFAQYPTGEWSVEACYRLTAFEQVPLSVERMLWLDGDTLVNKNIADFYHMDFEDNFYIACEDMAITHARNPEEYRRMQFTPEMPYINTGVLLMNIEKLRKERTADDFIQYMNNHTDALAFPDQSTINGMFFGKIYITDEMKYNCQVNTHHYTEKKSILSDACILHFSGSGQRPWNAECGRHFATAVPGDVWWKYQRILYGRYNHEYVKWKLLNTLYVKPWQIIYRVYRVGIRKT